MKMNALERKWEKILRGEGMPSEIPSEEEKATKAGVELISSDMTDPDALALEKKLKEEDPRNKLGGMPNSMEVMVNLIETVREEWLAQNLSPKDIHLVVHSSCINGSDCVALAYNGGNIYHYNTKNIRGYSRQKMISKLKNQNFSVIEK